MIFFKGGCPELHLVLFNESIKINVLGLSLMQSSLIFNPSVLSIKTFWKNSTTVEKKRIVLPELLWKHHVQLCYNLLKHDIASNITPASMHPPASRVWSQVTASKVLLLYIYINIGLGFECSCGARNVNVETESLTLKLSFAVQRKYFISIHNWLKEIQQGFNRL